MRLLLTGGAGYVGSACLRWMLRHGHDPFAYDDLSEGNAAAVPAERLIRGDILDGARLTETLTERRIEAVMHFAALASVPKSLEAPEAYWRTNVIGTKCLLDAMLAAKVKLLLFSSTAATYSFDAHMPLTEDAATIPQVPYGSTKLAAEEMIRDYSRAHGIGHAILRYFNAAGADPDGAFGEHRRDETHLIPLVLYAALGKRPKLKVYGTDWPTRDGSPMRDYVHTDDLALAHQLAVEALQPGARHIYNVGSGTGTTVLEVLGACERAVGRKIPHEIVARRPGDPAVLIATPARLERELGWKPRYPRIDEIVATAWRWHESHPDGYP